MRIHWVYLCMNEHLDCIVSWIPGVNPGVRVCLVIVVGGKVWGNFALTPDILGRFAQDFTCKGLNIFQDLARRVMPRAAGYPAAGMCP